MKCAILGRVAGRESWTSKTTGELVTRLSVQSGTSMLGINCSEADAFRDDEVVLVYGKARASKDGFFVKDAIVTLPTPEEVAIMQGRLSLGEAGIAAVG